MSHHGVAPRRFKSETLMPFAPGLAHHGEIPLFCPAVIGSRSWGLVSKNAITVMTRASGGCSSAYRSADAAQPENAEDTL